MDRFTRLISWAFALFAVALIAVVVYAGWSANRAAVQRERQLVENALDDGVSRVLDEQKSIAWWDDAVLHVGRPDVDFEWADTELGAFFNETYGHDEIFILNSQNEPVYAYIDGVRSDPRGSFEKRRAVIHMVVDEARQGGGVLRARARAFNEGQGNYRALLGAQNAAWSGHILDVDGRPAAVSAITIVPNVDASLLHGTPYMLVSIVEIDAAFMGDLGHQLLMPDLTVANDKSHRAGVVAEAFFADDGAAVGYLSWTSKKPGQGLLMIILPMVILGVAGATMFAMHMIRRVKHASGELADREEQARYKSRHDALSQLANRSHFAEVLSEKLSEQDSKGSSVVVAYIDVDRFKDINDTLGHAAGDELIKEVANRLKSYMGPSDFISRFGGDEFAVLRAPASVDDGDALADLLRIAFNDAFNVYGQKIRLTASIGLAMAPDHGRTHEELMRNADIALYEAKKHGRDRAMFFCANMAWDVERRRHIELALREALENEELTLHYQPLVSCRTNEITGVEALLRWRHPTQGDISPAVFIPIAEETGLMPALGEWILKRAMLDARQWPHIQVAINLSPVQFRHVDLDVMLADLVKKTNADPRQFVLEITEGVLLESTDRTRTILESLRKMGFKTALDDFGTGYSSLSYLCEYKFDKIKIDRTFVRGVSAGKRAMTVIQAVITIGRGLGMDVVAEGVETEAEASVLSLAGCNEIQGFFFSRPVPSEKIAGLIEEFKANAAAAAMERDNARGQFLRTINGTEN
ncbi:MAG: EAL domain-containing protein [Caulobacterales bacterium]